MIVEFAAAKVNLTLAVRGRRPDGYHELSSLVVFARDVADRLAVKDGPFRLTTTGPFAAGIEGPNLVSAASSMVEDAIEGWTLREVALEKTIPVAAGLGGGSADAAAYLRAAKTAAPPGTFIDWAGLARRLGADVPVCLANVPARVTGVGETLSPVAKLSPIFAVLVNPMVPVPATKTAEVFRRLGASPISASPRADVPTLPAHLDALLAEIERVGNDLERPAREVMPAIGPVLDALRGTRRCLIARLSGAGPTCFGIFRELNEAQDVSAELGSRHPAWWVRASRLS